MALVRNKSCIPRLSTEGIFEKPIPVGKSKTGAKWYSDLKPYERMFSHHTLASARRFAHFKPFSGLIPIDELDFILASPYDHSTEIFPDKIDTCLQAETEGLKSWRRLRNTRELKSVRDPNANPAIDVLGGFAAISGGARGDKKKPPYRYNDFHPVLISGITEKRHPSNVKLMLSSHHSPQTNAGYSRHDNDGTVFQY